MMQILIAIKKKYPPIWKLVEMVNGFLTGLLYPKLDDIASEVLANNHMLHCRFSRIEKHDIPELERFLNAQDKAYRRYFAPHGFDRIELERLRRNKGYILMKATSDEGQLLGYFFLRCFFIGKAFQGLIVDRNCAGHGIGAKMWNIGGDICRNTGLKMFATVSRKNIPSMSSMKKGLEIAVVKNLTEDYLLVECHVKTE